MPHTPPPLEDKPAQPANAELAKMLRGVAVMLEENKKPGAAAFVRLAAERLERIHNDQQHLIYHQRQLIEHQEREWKRLESVVTNLSATSHSTGEGEEGFHPG